MLFEKSTAVFHQHPASYLHYGKTCFDTGIEMELLQKFCLIAIDVFRGIPYFEDEKNEQKARLSLLTTENLEGAELQKITEEKGAEIAELKELLKEQSERN